MRKFNFKTRYALLLIFIIVIAAVWAIIIWFSYDSLGNSQDSFFDLQLDKFEGEVNAALKTYETFSNYIYDEIQVDPLITKTVYLANNVTENEKDKLRSDLYAHLEKEYEKIEKYEFRQLHFHLLNTESFLRMHAPEKYGDLLDEVRYSIVLANETQDKVYGFEEGRIYNGYRFVYPLWHESQMAGTVEVSINVASVFKLISELYPDEDYYFVIKEDVVSDKVFEEELVHYASSQFSKDYLSDEQVKTILNVYHTTITDDSFFFEQVQSTYDQRMNEENSFAVVHKYKKHDYVIKYLSVKNVAGDHVGYYISISESLDYRLLAYDFYRQLIIVTMLALSLIAIGLVSTRYQSKIKHSADFDHLTGTFNRYTFNNLSMKEFKRMKRYDFDATIMMLDIDHFKRINDTYGHDGGDQALIDLAKLIQANIRETDIFARWGGEEFIFMLPHTNKQDALRFAEKIRSLIEDCQVGYLKTVTVSIGIAPIDAISEDLKTAIDDADSAMYQAKQTGRNKICSASTHNAPRSFQ